jgi:hypothetical protein
MAQEIWTLRGGEDLSIKLEFVDPDADSLELTLPDGTCYLVVRQELMEAIQREMKATKAETRKR